MAEPTCRDLEERFPRYRLGWEADGATRSRWPRGDWPWLKEIRCRYGLVYPFGGDILQAFSDRPRIGARLRALPFVLHQQGDVETVIHVHVDHAPEVFAILRPYLRRRISDAERERLAAMGRQYRFEKGHSHGVQGDLKGANTAVRDGAHVLP